jgi:uncharacterized membrane protein
MRIFSEVTGKIALLLKRALQSAFPTTAMWGLAGVITGGIIHIAVIMAIPVLGTKNAWHKLSSSLGVTNEMVVLSALAKEKPVLPFGTGDVAVAVCVFDIRKNILTIDVKLPDDLWSVTMHNRYGDSFYVMDATKRSIDRVKIVLYTGEHDLSGLRALDEDDDEIQFIKTENTMGVIAVRAPLNGSAYRKWAKKHLREASCQLHEA